MRPRHVVMGLGLAFAAACAVGDGHETGRLVSAPTEVVPPVTLQQQGVADPNGWCRYRIAVVDGECPGGLRKGREICRACDPAVTLSCPVRAVCSRNRNRFLDEKRCVLLVDLVTSACERCIDPGVPFGERIQNGAVPLGPGWTCG